MLSSREVIRRIKAAGWRLDRVKGDHQQFRHPTLPGVTTVVHPSQDFAIKTLISMERQSGVNLRD